MRPFGLSGPNTGNTGEGLNLLMGFFYPLSWKFTAIEGTSYADTAIFLLAPNYCLQ